MVIVMVLVINLTTDVQVFNPLLPELTQETSILLTVHYLPQVKFVYPS